VRGYQVTQIVKGIASGITEIRPKWLGLLKDRLTRFGFRYLETL
jgi:predicted site-specific integrase-resolvase